MKLNFDSICCGEHDSQHIDDIVNMIIGFIKMDGLTVRIDSKERLACIVRGFACDIGPVKIVAGIDGAIRVIRDNINDLFQSIGKGSGDDIPLQIVARNNDGLCNGDGFSVRIFSEVNAKHDFIDVVVSLIDEEVCDGK